NFDGLFTVRICTNFSSFENASLRDLQCEQRWDRAGRVGFGGMTRPARQRDLDFPDRPARRPSGFRPSDRLGPMFWSLRATRLIIFRVSPRLGTTRSRNRPCSGRVSIHYYVLKIYSSVQVIMCVI